MLRLAARVSAIRRMMERHVHFGAWLARTIGSRAGGIGYEIEDTDGRIVRWTIASSENSYLVAVAPAVLAVRAILEGRFVHRGLVMPGQHAEPRELWAFLEKNGITITESDDERR
jgi:hypothetical protein